MDDPFSRLIRQWTPLAEAKERDLTRLYPGEDWWPVAARALTLAARRYLADPSRPFPSYFRWGVWAEIRGELRRWRRRHLTVRSRADVLWRAPGKGSSPLDRLVVAEEAARLPGLIAALPDRERDVIRSRFFEGRTLEEAGARFDRTREWARLAEARALATLRSRLADP